MLGFGKTLLLYIHMFELEFKQLFALIRIGFEEFLYKGNVGVLGEMLSKFSKTMFLF